MLVKHKHKTTIKIILSKSIALLIGCKYIYWVSVLGGYLYTSDGELKISTIKVSLWKAIKFVLFIYLFIIIIIIINSWERSEFEF